MSLRCPIEAFQPYKQKKAEALPNLPPVSRGISLKYRVAPISERLVKESKYERKNNYLNNKDIL